MNKPIKIILDITGGEKTCGHNCRFLTSSIDKKVCDAFHFEEYPYYVPLERDEQDNLLRCAECLKNTVHQPTESSDRESYEVTATVTFKIKVDNSAKYPKYRSEAGKAEITAKRKLMAVLGDDIVFESHCIRETLT